MAIMWSRIAYIIFLNFINDGITAGDCCDINTGSAYNNLTDIHIIGFFPCTDPNDTRGIPVDNCDGIERIPIMKLALEEINERCDLLPGYRLVVDYANSACSSIPATYHLIQQTDPSQPTKLMILGPACSAAAELMGELAERHLNIPQVAYTASSSLFGRDKESYPRFYRMVPITEQLADGYVALAKRLNWNRVAVISYDNEFYLNLGLHTVEQLTPQQVLTHASFIDDDPSHIVNLIKELNARIIIAWIPHTVAIKFWCIIIRENLAGPDFVWFFPGWYRASWWAAVDGTDCTAEEMSKALEHSLGALGNGVLDNDPSRVLVSDKDVAQFKQDLEAKNSLGAVKTDIFLNIGYVYDAVWTIALALNLSISILEERGLGRLEDFTYDLVEMADVFTEAILNVSFEGISGNVSFQKNGNRNNPLVRLFQYRDGLPVSVTIYDTSNDSDSFIELPGQSLMWQGGYVPKDAPSPEVQGDSKSEIIIVATATSLGILSTTYFFIFNIYYRNNLVVKRSSYRLNSLILAGVLIGYTGTLLHIIQLDSDMSRASVTAICNIRHWMTELAFVVCFATLFIKIWRLYRVFFNKQMAQRKYLADQYLLLMIACISAPTLLILIIQVATYPITLHSYAEINEDNLAQEEIFYMCKGKYYLIFSGTIFIGDTVLALLSLVVAFKTKKHLPADKKYRKYHESAVINLTTLMAIVLSSICEAVLIIFQLNNIRSGTLLIITLRECLWLYPISFLLFIPKVYRVYRGIIQPHKRTLLAQRVSVFSRRSVLSRQNTNELSDITSRWRRKQFQRESSTASMISDGGRSSTSSCESSMCELPQRNTYRRVTFSLTADLTIHENINENETDDVFDNCIVIAHSEVVQEETDLKKDNLVSENDIHCEINV